MQLCQAEYTCPPDTSRRFGCLLSRLPRPFAEVKSVSYRQRCCVTLREIGASYQRTIAAVLFLAYYAAGWHFEAEVYLRGWSYGGFS